MSNPAGFICGGCIHDAELDADTLTLSRAAKCAIALVGLTAAGGISYLIYRSSGRRLTANEPEPLRIRAVPRGRKHAPFARRFQAR